MFDVSEQEESLVLILTFDLRMCNEKSMSTTDRDRQLCDLLARRFPCLLDVCMSPGTVHLYFEGAHGTFLFGCLFHAAQSGFALGYCCGIV